MNGQTGSWRVLQQSVLGTAHVRDQLPCQDFCHAVLTRPTDEEFLVAACADGAGSAELSQDGARIACTHIVQLICRDLQAGLRADQIDRERFADWFRSVHAAVEQEAQSRNVPRRQLACTLLVVVAGSSATAVAQVGDGAIVTRSADGYAVAFWPQMGEFLNLTHFVTDDSYEQTLEVAKFGRVDEVAVMTDGLQMLALDFARRAPHQPFFKPMFDALRAAEEPDDLVVPFRGFLDSPQVNEKTDDDKTLIVATRLTDAAAVAG